MSTEDLIKQYLYDSLLELSQKKNLLFLQNWFNNTLEGKEDFKLGKAHISPRITLSEKGRLKTASERGLSQIESST